MYGKLDTDLLPLIQINRYRTNLKNSTTKILVTGAAGFIGFHLCKKLIPFSNLIIGIDNLNNYYDQKLKKDRLEELKKLKNKYSCRWEFIKCDLCDKENLNNIFLQFKPTIVIHLAAQAGVRNSIANPHAYINSNIVGFSNLLECNKKNKTKNFIYASSSSVYGGNENIPFSEKDNVDHPLSLYAATKKANELFAHTYSHLYNIPSTGLRFFTVYGPWGRPDMAPMIFAKAILNNKPIKIFNKGDMQRDFTYIDDVINIIIKLLYKPAQPDINFNKRNPSSDRSWAPHRIFNIGNSNPINLLSFIELIEKEIGIKSIREFQGMQLGDVKMTFANTESLENFIGYKPNTSIDLGVKKFIKWYLDYYTSKK